MMLDAIRGRASRSLRPSVNVSKTIIQTVLFWSFFLFVVPAGIVWLERAFDVSAMRFEFSGMRITGIVVFAVCGSLGLWSGWTMAVLGAGTPLPLDCPNRLVVRGPYRWTRNPMVIAGLGQGIGVGIFLGSWLVLVYSLIGGVVWERIVRPWEERDLHNRFGNAYQRYRDAVPCWRVRVRAYRPD